MLRNKKKLEPEKQDELENNVRRFIFYHVNNHMEKFAIERNFTITTDAIAMLSELTFLQLEIFVKDLVAFSRHAKRKVICGSDVKLLARRNSKLLLHLEEFAATLKENKITKKKRKKINIDETCENGKVNIDETCENGKINIDEICKNNASISFPIDDANEFLNNIFEENNNMVNFSNFDDDVMILE